MDKSEQDKSFVFVSYSRKDTEDTEYFFDLLERNHINFWYDTSTEEKGLEWAEEISHKIRTCNQFILLISRYSQTNESVRSELEMALATKRHEKIITIFLDDIELNGEYQFMLKDIQQIKKKSFFKTVFFEDEIFNSISLHAFTPDYFIKYDCYNGPARRELKKHYHLLWKLEDRWNAPVYLAVNKKTHEYVTVKYKYFEKDYPSRHWKRISEDIYFNDLQFLLKPCIARFTSAAHLREYFYDDHSLYLVTDYIKGRSLDTMYHCSEEQVVDLTIRMLRILRYLHFNNIIYRDVRPSSFIEDTSHELHIRDFSISMMYEKHFLSDLAVVGTPGFAPPEQYNPKGSCVCYASDIYALGQTMKYLLCSEEAAIYDNPEIPIRSYNKDISPELEAIIKKMTQPDIQDRYQSADEVLDALKKYKEPGKFKKATLLAYSSLEIRQRNKVDDSKIDPIRRRME